MNDAPLRVETRDGIQTITINRPEARNALTLAMRRELRDLFAAVAVDNDVAVVVLTGADPDFCAGVDVKELRAGTAAGTEGEVTDPASALRAVPKPVIGTRRAVELSLTGAFIDADTAMRYGLVNHVVPHEDLLARSNELATEMRDLDPDARRTVLGLYRRAAGLPVNDALTLEREAFEAWRATRSLG